MSSRESTSSFYFLVEVCHAVAALPKLSHYHTKPPITFRKSNSPRGASPLPECRYNATCYIATPSLLLRSELRCSTLYFLLGSAPWQIPLLTALARTAAAASSAQMRPPAHIKEIKRHVLWHFCCIFASRKTVYWPKRQCISRTRPNDILSAKLGQTAGCRPNIVQTARY